MDVIFILKLYFVIIYFKFNPNNHDSIKRSSLQIGSSTSVITTMCSSTMIILVFKLIHFHFSPNNKLVLSRSTSDALLNSRISLPRIGNYQCDHCGHRNYGCSPGDTGHMVTADQFLVRPHSVYADDSNYLRFSFKVQN